MAGILLIVGTVVFAKVKASLGDEFQYNNSVNATNSEATRAIANVEATTYDSFELATVALIVLAAAVIIGILISAWDQPKRTIVGHLARKRTYLNFRYCVTIPTDQ